MSLGYILITTRIRVKRALPVMIMMICALAGAGCTHTIQRHYITDELPDHKTETVLLATMKDGSTVRFDDNGGSFVWKSSADGRTLHVAGITDTGEQRMIPASDIVEACTKVEKGDKIGTLLTTATIVSVATVGAVIVIFASWGGH